MDMADRAKKGDVILKKNGVKVFLEKETSKLLSKATLDYSGKQGILISGMPRPTCCG